MNRLPHLFKLQAALEVLSLQTDVLPANGRARRRMQLKKQFLRVTMPPREIHADGTTATASKKEPLQRLASCEALHHKVQDSAQAAIPVELSPVTPEESTLQTRRAPMRSASEGWAAPVTRWIVSFRSRP
jgi:hypothetical protein